uniref:40S ribosomal protein S27 n=1 Tax=Triticum urartu TaxID=4572 RepID=A0A8R7VCN6_TRIUA
MVLQKLEKPKHKKKRLAQSPNSFFMDVSARAASTCNCKRTTVFSYSQTMVVCAGWQTVLCQPTGGKREGCSFHRKGNTKGGFGSRSNFCLH